MTDKEREIAINFHAKTIMPREASSISEAQKLIEHLVGKPITNIKFGITATISKKNIGKYGSEEAAKKSISPRLHAKAVANIDYLFEIAEIDVTQSDSKHRVEVQQVHRIGALMFDEQADDYAPIMITAVEYKKDGNRIYSVEAVDLIEKRTPTNAGVKELAGLTTASDHNAVRQVPSTNFNTKIQQLLENAREAKEYLTL